MCLRGRPQGQTRPRGLHLWYMLQIYRLQPIGVDFLLIKQIPRGRKFFCEVWLNLVSIETILSVKSCGFSDIDNL